jgi:hypothetical protein
VIQAVFQRPRGAISKQRCDVARRNGSQGAEQSDRGSRTADDLARRHACRPEMTDAGGTGRLAQLLACVVHHERVMQVVRRPGAASHSTLLQQAARAEPGGL